MVNQTYYQMPKQQTYRLIIDIELYQYMMVLAKQSAPNEILGIGMMTKREFGYITEFIVEEVFVPRQEVAPGYCTFAENAQNEIMNEILERGDSTEMLRFRWHSHGDGEVFFSPIDENDIDKCDSDYVVNLVVNARCDKVARLDILDPVRVRNIPLEVVIDAGDDKELVEECKEEILKNCRLLPEKVFAPRKKKKNLPILPRGGVTFVETGLQRPNKDL